MDKTILLVEDNPDDVKLTLRAFKRSNILNPIDVARDGIEALDYLHARDTHTGRAGMPLPAVVLLDLKLPRLDGLGVLKAMRLDARTRLLPVVILTSSQEEQDVVASYTNGANSYVRKPVNFADFLGVAQNLGIYWMLLNHPLPERT